MTKFVEVEEVTLKELVLELSLCAFVDEAQHGSELHKVGFPIELTFFEVPASKSEFEMIWNIHGKLLENTPGLYDALKKIFK